MIYCVLVIDIWRAHSRHREKFENQLPFCLSLNRQLTIVSFSKKLLPPQIPPNERFNQKKREKNLEMAKI
jgi:hypothetical protein